jgi:hypothetical protein
MTDIYGMKNISLIALLTVCYFITSIVTYSQSVSPDTFLGYNLGEKFTRHHRVVDYLEHVSQENPHFQLRQYGTTTENRPLLGLIMSSENNMKIFDDILSENFRRVNKGVDSGARIPIIYLSYNVHGNEAVCTEAAMRTIGSLTNQRKNLLENCIVIIDPCVNPDGRDRYVHFQDRTSGPTPNSSPAAWEHSEPWPGGRSNHYMFDMNRDLAWQTQKETKARTAFYRSIMPHIHVDYHEQGINEPYYFAPAAEPLHKIITPWQRKCQEHIGGFNASGFDARGALYFTKEIFDLFYPSYGDTWPMFQGAIGMTYEQGGSGRAGRSIITETGDLLSLSYRIENHHSTAISTIEAAIHHRDRLLKEFAAYHRRNIEEPWGDFTSYLIPLTGNDLSKINWLTDLLDRQGLTYSTARGSKKPIAAFDYNLLSSNMIQPLKGDLVIDAHQPNSALLQVLFDPDPELSDSLTYDITTWALPFAYGLKSWGLNTNIEMTDGFITPINPVQSDTAMTPYAWIIEYRTDAGTPLLAQLLMEGIKVRVADAPFTNSGENFSSGSLVITRLNNEDKLENIEAIVTEHTSKTAGIKVLKTHSGMSEEGPDLGSDHFQYIKSPSIAVISGEEVSSLSFGEILHRFETIYNYPITVISDHTRLDLDSYDVLIIPRSWISFNENELEELQNWVASGGTLISIGGSCRNFADKNGWGLSRFSGEMDESNRMAEYDAHSTSNIYAPFALNDRLSVMDAIPGAVYSISLDPTHPLAFGYNTTYLSIKTSSMRFSPLSSDSGSNVGVLKGDAEALSGFAGSIANEKLNNSLSFGVQSIGSGSAIYLIDNVLFRGFWKNGHKFFANAVFFSPAM